MTEKLQASDKNGWFLCLDCPIPDVSLIRVSVGVDGVDVDDANVDIDVVMLDGGVHHRVLMTPQNAASLLAQWRISGESGHGAFLKVENMVLVPSLEASAIVAAVTAMFDEGEFN